jgi:hypothetical protein
MVKDTFPSFRDERWFEVCSTISFFSVRHSTHELAPGPQRVRARAHCLVFFWKRAQILTAETWAAFSTVRGRATLSLPARYRAAHHFADYRVLQVLHHLRLLTYTPILVCALKEYEEFAGGA